MSYFLPFIKFNLTILRQLRVFVFTSLTTQWEVGIGQTYSWQNLLFQHSSAVSLSSYLMCGGAWWPLCPAEEIDRNDNACRPIYTFNLVMTKLDHHVWYYICGVRTIQTSISEKKTNCTHTHTHTRPAQTSAATAVQQCEARIWLEIRSRVNKAPPTAAAAHKAEQKENMRL